MPITRKLLMPALLSLAIAPLSLTALADGHRGGSHAGPYDGGPRAETLLERLDLDAETRAALEATRDAHRQAYRELREQDFDDRETRREAYRALHAEHRAELDELLDEEQRQALAEARQEHREARRAAMQTRLDAVIDGWELSAEQHEALNTTREAIASDLAEFRDREFDNREARREAMAELRDAHHADLAEILDEAQLDELKEALRPSRGDHHGKGRDRHRHQGD
ncbi:hypothetical protein [Halomonas sp. 328]|uniref:hypothetical protein n=1 Tax=Halomonas sp. 328 TaxID=2776704 RepID=UPI0018A7689A|nr:hypothetical protein [Halomonas sp. 328]MBF8223093.1 hypothetical protein [Halomonas sp. 328]